jgi:hypothetical protein
MHIPIIIGVTGHRDIRKQDEEKLTSLVREALTKIKDDCPHSRIVMLNSLAAGADQLCAAVALELGVALIVPLPLPLAEYRQDFSYESLEKLNLLLARAQEVFVVPPMEPVREGRDFCYRQAGIYVASNSHLLLALWDGRAALQGGCGTAEAVGFMLEQNYSSNDSLFKAKGDGAVVHIVTPRANKFPVDVFLVTLLENKAGSAQRILAQTDAFNNEHECEACLYFY